MKRLLSIILLAAALAAAPASGQTVKSLGYNTTNGNIVAATNVTFTNSVGFATNARAATRTNLGGTTVGNSVFTATNAAAATTAIGLGATNNVTFAGLTAGYVNFENVEIGPDLKLEEDGDVLWGTLGIFNLYTLEFSKAISFNNTTNAATTRTNLGLGLPALTNTSNVTTMRALAGSTNTNQPFSGSISVVGTNNTNTLVFSNGILLSQ